MVKEDLHQDKVLELDLDLLKEVLEELVPKARGLVVVLQMFQEQEDLLVVKVQGQGLVVLKVVMEGQRVHKGLAQEVAQQIQELPVDQPVVKEVAQVQAQEVQDKEEHQHLVKDLGQEAQM